MFNNFTTMLNSLDNIAQENLEEEPKISATSLRQQKREAASSIDFPDPSADLLDSSASKIAAGSKNNSEASFVLVDETDNLSDNTTSPTSAVSSISFTDNATSLAMDRSDRPPHPPQSQQSHRKDTFQPSSLMEASSSEARLFESKDSRQVILSKNKEIEKLNRECLELETLNEGLKQEVRDAWGAYKSSQEKAALRESDYQEDMSQLERAKNTDREGMAVHVQSMEEELKSNRAETAVIRTEHERVVKLLHTVQEEAKEWMSSKAKLEASLAVAQANSNHSLQGLREEIMNKDAYIESLQNEHSNVMRNAHQRYDDLEKANSDLTSTLMAKERELSRLSAEQLSSVGGRDSALQAEVSKLCMQLEQMSGALLEEQEQHQSCKKRLRASEQETDINKSTWEEEKQMLLSRISELVSAQSAQTGDSSCSRSGVEGEGSSDCEVEVKRLEEQLRTLGQQLLRQQENVEEYLSERSALKVRLGDSQRRCKKAEEQVVTLLEAQDPYDQESGMGIIAPGSEGGGLRKRVAGSTFGAGGGGAKRSLRASQDLEKLGVHPSPGVTKAVDMIDTWTLITGRHLKAYPLVRLLFVFYLVFIHLWALCLLAYHAHSLDLDNENANAMTSNNLGGYRAFNSS